jgi:hypothetical protein
MLLTVFDIKFCLAKFWLAAVGLSPAVVVSAPLTVYESCAKNPSPELDPVGNHVGLRAGNL